MYLLWKEELKVGNSYQLRERQLYHATSPTNALSISQNNIDWRKTYRSRFGIGACFSTCPKYAHRHSSSDGAFMICKVLTKKIEVVDVNYDLDVPTKCENDTSLSKTGKVYVKYDDNTFYPEFIVYYR
ncbi:protein mono-ADP-ribosyltransferase PARP12-like [Acyrthosiphon pisum]|uniref:PARP catalytic domain-containing protein n=1 Tax=Acyrthosiphon pisum TaxID=7029 RepID=A0A8R2JVZ9_ACYPI|nr:protein mono-ADP-ribosyltransferase PARP12-like [Acyrthosiphon pisum]